MVAASTETVVVSELNSALNLAVKLNWAALKTAFQQSDWVDVGFISAEDALSLVSPFVPEFALETATAMVILKFAAGLADSWPKDGQPFNVEKLIEGITTAEGIDWVGLQKAMQEKNPVLAATILTSDVIKIIMPFVSVPLPLEIVVTALVFVGSNMGGTVLVTPAGPINTDDPYSNNFVL